jgi:hypothetical protein
MSVALCISEGGLFVAVKASAPAARSRSPLAAGLRSQLSLLVHRRAPSGRSWSRSQPCTTPAEEFPFEVSGGTHRSHSR